MTGASGFVGRWLCRELVRRSWKVAGTTLEEPERGLADWTELAAVDWSRTDVRRADELGVALDRARPDAVFHLAGVSFVPAASADPGAALEVNVIAAARLLAEVRTRRRSGAIDPVVLVVGSGMQYGRHPREEMPLREDAVQRPASVYAASKAAQELVAMEAFQSEGLRVVATRSFNHSGPGQPVRFVIPKLVARVLALRGRREAVLDVGNPAPVRDYLHVADVVDAYILLAERGMAGEAYNVASGTGTDVGALVSRILAITGIDAKLQHDDAPLRPDDLPVLIGDNGKLRAVGWTPRRSLDTIIDDLIRASAD